MISHHGNNGHIDYLAHSVAECVIADGADGMQSERDDLTVYVTTLFTSSWSSHEVQILFEIRFRGS